ncbi:MAG TPA: PucR family transcriptional regulator [Anaerolineae bacterium]|nr:PucR family transcriptional regulator [Anaerolineae bacterium]
MQAADALVIHRNTLLYRLRKVEGLCEINLSDPLERLNLHLAIKYHRLHAV